MFSYEISGHSLNIAINSHRRWHFADLKGPAAREVDDRCHRRKIELVDVGLGTVDEALECRREFAGIEGAYDQPRTIDDISATVGPDCAGGTPSRFFGTDLQRLPERERKPNFISTADEGNARPDGNTLAERAPLSPYGASLVGVALPRIEVNEFVLFCTVQAIPAPAPLLTCLVARLGVSPRPVGSASR